VRWVLGIWIAVALVAGATAAVAAGGPTRFGEDAARRCGEGAARVAGLRPHAASARLDGSTWRVAVATDSGVFGMLVRDADRLILDVRLTGPGGPTRLQRDARLAVFERGC